MFKWVEISLEPNKARFELLSQVLNEANFVNELSFQQTSLVDFEKVFFAALENFDGIRIGRGLGEKVTGLYNRKSLMVDRIGAADTLIQQDGEYWLRAYGVEGFSRVIKSLGNKVDNECPTLMIGCGSAARMAVTALFLSGVKKFSISSLETAQVKKFVADLSKVHMGADFRVIPKSELILLPATHSLIVNTTPMSEDNPMLEEIYYFNFFKAGGLAIDFSILPIETPLLTGAREVGAHCVSGYKVSAATDCLWANELTGKSFDIESYEKRLLEVLKKNA